MSSGTTRIKPARDMRAVRCAAGGKAGENDMFCAPNYAVSSQISDAKPLRSFNWLTFGVAFLPRAFHLCVVDSSAIIPPGPREGPPEPDRPFDLNSQRMNFNAYPAEGRSSRVPLPENEH